jgi:hypothetical protein
VKPPVPPQLASDDTALVGEATGVELRVEVPTVLLGRIVEETSVDEGRMVEDKTTELLL